MKAPERIETGRLLLRKPCSDDADEIFNCYAGDPEVTRWISWPTHESVENSRAFLAFSDSEWEHWPAGPYLVLSRKDGRVLGCTGLGFETPSRVSTGYVFSKNSWGKGYATEALLAMVDVARSLEVVRLYALCHEDNMASWRVLEKCGFNREGILHSHTEFPNLVAGELCDVFCYSLILS
jgi:[ribosomal protein S5]-alanine N-acetyltransferase